MDNSKDLDYERYLEDFAVFEQNRHLTSNDIIKKWQYIKEIGRRKKSGLSISAKDNLLYEESVVYNKVTVPQITCVVENALDNHSFYKNNSGARKTFIFMIRIMLMDNFHYKMPELMIWDMLSDFIIDFERKETGKAIQSLQNKYLKSGNTAELIKEVNESLFLNDTVLQIAEVMNENKGLYHNSLSKFYTKSLDYLKTKKEYESLTAVKAKILAPQATPITETFEQLFKPEYTPYIGKFIDILTKLEIINDNGKWLAKQNKGVAKVFFEELAMNDVIKSTIKQAAAARAFQNKFDGGLIDTFMKPIGKFANTSRPAISQEIKKVLSSIRTA